MNEEFLDDRQTLSLLLAYRFGLIKEEIGRKGSDDTVSDSNGDQPTGSSKSDVEKLVEAVSAEHQSVIDELLEIWQTNGFGANGIAPARRKTQQPISAERIR